MKITLQVRESSGGGVRPVTETRDSYATVRGPCPECGRIPFKVAGHGRRISDDDRAYEADGSCVDCGQGVGLIRAEANTLFGLREDERVLSGAYGIVIGAGT